MNNTISLNDLYTDYAAGLLDRKKLEAAIFETVRENVHDLCIPGWKKEDYDDFLSWLYFRICRAIGTYRETGASFETYIGALVRMTAKEYRVRLIRDYTEESAAWVTQIPDMYACEREPDYDEQATEAPVKLRNPRQILILILKCYSYISMDFLEKIAPSLGMDMETLCAMIARLQKQRERHEAELVLLREKVNHQLFRCILCEQNLRAMAEDPIATQRLKDQLRRRRTRLFKARKRLARMHTDPSNLQIAEILGITKGTVDSVMYKLRGQRTFGTRTNKKNPVAYPNDRIETVLPIKLE